MPEDIRDKAFISHDDMADLNFINDSGPYTFRRHYRQGLRSHIMEVLKRSDVEREKTGVIIDGIRKYPKAEPVKMFRIFRARLKTLEDVLRETDRVKIVEHYLAPDYLVMSSEIIVDYDGPQGHTPLLCGIQAYEAGEILDPWSILDRQPLLTALYDSLQGSIEDLRWSRTRWAAEVKKSTAEFIRRVKTMVYQAGYIPDLAGIGNLVAVPAGRIKLVDINNISKVIFDAVIRLDDRGYPVCDKSVEALYRIENTILERAADSREAIYRTFLDPDRMQAVKDLEKNFYEKDK